MALPKKNRPVSVQQQRVVKFIILGYSYNDGCAEMGIQYSTFITHVNRLRMRYHCDTKTEIVVEALQDGFTCNTSTRQVFYNGKVIL